MAKVNVIKDETIAGGDLARRSDTGANWVVIGGAAGGILLLVLAFVAYRFLAPQDVVADANIDSCLPQNVYSVRANSTAAIRSPGNVTVYLDASGGMAGYVASNPNVIGNLTTLSRNFVQSSLYSSSRNGQVEFRRFGEYRFDPEGDGPPVIEDVTAFARSSAYNETDTHIADLLQWIVRSQDGELSVIVTDLMLDDREAVDQFEASVGGILRNLVIDEGMAAGILAVRVPFSGRIFVEQQTFSANLPDRPLTVLLIGSPYQVRTFHEYLRTSEIAPFSADTPVSNRAFALFGLEAGSIELVEPELSGVSTGFLSRPAATQIPGSQGIRSVTYDTAIADRDSEGGVVVNLAANAGVEDFEVIGNEPLWESAVWRLDPSMMDAEGCANGAAWMRVGNLPPMGWQRNGQTITYTLTPDVMEQVGMDREGTYLVQFLAGQQGLTPDHPAAEWMREWSMSNDELATRLGRSSGARSLGVPGLQPLRNILMTELMMPGREQIERSASYIIIETE